MSNCARCGRVTSTGRKCDCVKTAKKIIKFKTLNNPIFTLDKIFNFIKVDILELDYISDCENGVVSKVTYKKGLRLWHPVTWCIFIVFFIMLLIQSIYENICDIARECTSEEYTDTIKLKSKE